MKNLVPPPRILNFYTSLDSLWRKLSTHVACTMFSGREFHSRMVRGRKAFNLRSFEHVHRMSCLGWAVLARFDLWTAGFNSGHSTQTLPSSIL